MRIGIREQLAVLVLLAVLTSLAILSIPTWLYVNNFVGSVKSQAMALTASLKAAQIASVLDQLQVISNALTSRVLVQDTVRRYYTDNVTAADWTSAHNALQTALISSAFVDLLQARVYSCNATVPGTDPVLLLNITTPTDLALPSTYGNGSFVKLGDPGLGFPSMLYPNLTRGPNFESVQAFPGVDVTTDYMLLLGPLILNDTYALISLTQPMVSNTDQDDVLGYVTVIAAAKDLFKIETSLEGLGDGGVTLLIGPSDEWNRFNSSFPTANRTNSGDIALLASAWVKFVIPVTDRPGQPPRHDGVADEPDQSFQLVRYPAALQAYSEQLKSVNNATGILQTTNENSVPVSVGVARPPTSLVDWVVVVEQSQDEALAPIALLRKILLICVFATVALVLIIVLPCAHLSVLPIRRLKEATMKFVEPPGYSEDGQSSDKTDFKPSSTPYEKQRGITGRLKAFFRFREIAGHASHPELSGNVVRIPGKVELRRHFLVDELTDLSLTFNHMSDEIMQQYTQLEDKVAERTKELELSKKAAEAANQSKTVFLANVSHELKTPLNGILGMCAVCMEDHDLPRIHRSLKTVYESGRLLLRLLEDLLNFARHEVAQPTRLEENLFSLSDFGGQISAFFTKDSHERDIDFAIHYINPDSSSTQQPPFDSCSPAHPAPCQSTFDLAQPQTMQLWGDQQRILQIIINLIGNGLKFTPAGGRVDLRIRCLGEESLQVGSRPSKASRHAAGIACTGSDTSAAANVKRRSNEEIPMPGNGNPESKPTENGHLPVFPASAERGSIPPISSRPYIFEFEVEDNGHGIPEDIQQRVFEPFVQGEIGLSRKYGGAGLGLAICRQLASLMGGSISLKSTVGVGSCFTFRVPLSGYLSDVYRVSLAPTSATSLRTSGPESTRSLCLALDDNAESPVDDKSSRSLHPPRSIGSSAPPWPSPPAVADHAVDLMGDFEASTAANSPSGPTILVADDNSTNLEVLSRMLMLEKVSDVQVARDGQEAYDKVKAAMAVNKPFDIIFMDIQMPEMDGIQSTKLIRSLGYTQPIVALSAFAEDGIVKECAEAGIDKFMSKPVTRRAIKDVLKTMCATSFWQSDVNTDSSEKKNGTG